MPNFIGRRVSVGLGVESTPGTEVAPAAWIRQLSLDFQRKTTTIQNESAMGRVEKVNDSAVVETWAEGKLEGKVYDNTIGFLLYNIFGTKVTTTNADGSGSVKDHTFSVNQSQTAKTLTVNRQDPVGQQRRHGLATLDSLELSGDAGDWVKLSASLKAKPGVSASDTVAYVAENEFTAKHLTVKLATNTAGLSGATAIPAKSFKLTINRPAEAYYPFGTVVPSSFDQGTFEASGEIVLQYTATTQKDLWFANTIQALSIAIKNTDVTIGTSANPSLTFTAPRVRLNTFDMSNDLDKVVEATIGFYCELDTTSSAALTAVLTNTIASY